MKIALLNVCGIGSNDGSRLILSLLKNAGHSVQSVFFTQGDPQSYTDETISQLASILDDTELVLISVYSYYAILAVQVTEFIRKNYPGLQVIWGGPHCVSAPDLSLRYADGVCFAEADLIIVDLVNKIAAGVDYTDTPNMAFNVNGETVHNSVIQPIQDLDSLPYPDYSSEDQYFLDVNLEQMTKTAMRKYWDLYPFDIPTYWILTARGCPFTCSYCNNCRYVTMHGSQSLRFRSVDHFIGELELVFNNHDFFTHMMLSDDDFMARPLSQIEEFAEKYKNKIGIPFGIEASAIKYRKDKFELLLDAGLILIELGVQSGSERVLKEVFNRPIKAAKTLKVVQEIERYHSKHGVRILTDFIIDNPYETPDDIMESYRFICKMSPAITKLNVFVLTFFPGSPIYERALADGFIEPFSEITFKNYLLSQGGKIIFQANYETLLVLIVRHSKVRYLPNIFLRFLGCNLMRKLGGLIPKPLLNYLLKFFS